MKRILLLTALLLAPAPSFCTAVMVARTDSATYIAADSLVLTRDGKPDQWCKIERADDYVFSSSGLLRETRGQLDIRDIVRDAVSVQNSFEDAVHEIESRLAEALPQMIRDVEAIGGAKTDAVGVGRSVLQIVVAHPEKGAVRLAFRDFVRSTESYPYDIDMDGFDCPGAACADIRVMALGEHSAIDTEMAADRKLIKTLGAPAALNRLIELQGAATPDEVAAPVAIIEIGNDGKLVWVQKGKCG
jgi:hypothetical protein